MVVHSYIIKLLSIMHGICKSFHYRFSIADLFFYLLEKHLENRYLGVELNDQWQWAPVKAYVTQKIYSGSIPSF